MPFTQAPAYWAAAGVEPPTDLKTNGWVPEQKPPASYFNWYFNRTYLALQELQDKAAEAANVIPTSQKGTANGVATLGSDGKVPAGQLNVSSTANKITITDAANYFEGNEVEAALQEIGQVIGATRTSLVTSANNILGS